MNAFDARIKELYESGMTSSEAVTEELIRENIEYFASLPLGECLALKERVRELKRYTQI